jgi:mono/diheme cytochrome c family protein
MTIGSQTRLTLLVLMLAGSAAHAVDAPKTTAGGVFTEEQAKNGEQAYLTGCSACHGLDLRRVDAEAPDLTDGPFRFGWQGKTIAERLEKTRATMPKGNPKSLDDQTYLDIVVYLLRANGVPAGSEQLKPDMAALEQITIEVPAAAPGGGGSRRRR